MALDLEDAKRTIFTLQGEISAKETTLKIAQDDIARLKVENEKLDGVARGVFKLNRDYEILMQENKKLQNTIDELNRQLNDKSSQNAEITAIKKECGTQVAFLALELNRVTAQLAELRIKDAAALKELESVRTALKQNMDKLASIESARNKIKNMMQQIDTTY